MAALREDDRCKPAQRKETGGGGIALHLGRAQHGGVSGELGQPLVKLVAQVLRTQRIGCERHEPIPVLHQPVAQLGIQHPAAVVNAPYPPDRGKVGRATAD